MGVDRRRVRELPAAATDPAVLEGQRTASWTPYAGTALHRSPPPRQRTAARLLRLIWDVFWWLRGPLRATTRVRGHPRVGESRKWPSHALCGAFLAGFWVRTPQSAWHAPEDLSRASERIRRISRQMCRNRLLPVVVWAGSLVMALSGGAWAQIHSKPPFPYRRRSFDCTSGDAAWSTNTQSEPATAAARPRRMPQRRPLRRVAYRTWRRRWEVSGLA